MDTRYYMVIIKGEIKTSEVISCVYDRMIRKWDVKFNNGRVYSYAYENVEKITNPTVLNTNMYRIGRAGRMFFDIEAIYVFETKNKSYWHICFKDGSERDYCKTDLQIIESCLNQEQTANVFAYIKQIAGLLNFGNNEINTSLLKSGFERISFVGNNVALAKYLRPFQVLCKR